MTTGAEAVDLRELRTLAESGRYREVLARLERLPLPDVEKRTPLSLLAAEAHGRLGELSAAARWATLALATSRQRGEPQAELRARNYQGLIALRQGDIDAAERHLTAALEMAEAIQRRGSLESLAGGLMKPAQIDGESEQTDTLSG